MAKDALGHGSESRGGGDWQSKYLAAQRAHDVGGAISDEPHSAGVHALPRADGSPGGKPKDEIGDQYPGLAAAMRSLAATPAEQANARRDQSGLSDADIRGMRSV